MALNECELEEQLKEVGNKLLDPPASVKEILHLLDNIEHLLLTAEQAPSRAVQDALLSPMKALISDALLRHSDSNVKILVASCLTEITRITAPDAPYGDDQMKEIFQLAIAAFENLTDISSQSYRKAFSILDTVAKVRSCLVMLDLELDELVADMFRLFLRIISCDHPPNVFLAMEKIMTMVINESEDISLDLLLILLYRVRKDVQNQSPVGQKLATKVITNCRAKLKPYLQEAVKLGYVLLDEYSLIVSSICEEEGNDSAETADYESGHERNGIRVGRKMKMELETGKRKSGKKSKSLMNREEKSGQKAHDVTREKAVGQSVDVFTSSTKRNPSGGILARKGQAMKKESSADKDVDPGVILGAHSAERDNGSDVASLKRKSKQRTKSGVKMQKQARNQYRGEHASQHLKVEKNGKIHSTKSEIKGMDLALVQTGEADEDHISDTCNGKKGKSLKRRRSNDKESPETESKNKRSTPKEMVSEVPDPGELLIDKRIKVWWPMDKAFYDGVVTEYDPIKKRHTILYTDGDQEVLNLKKQRWELIGNLTSPKEEQGVSKGKGSSDVSKDAGISKVKKGRRKKPTADAKERGLKAGSETVVHKKHRIRSPTARNSSQFESREASSEGTIDNQSAEVETPKQSKSKPLSSSESGMDHPASEFDATDEIADAKTAETGILPDNASAGNELCSGNDELSGQ